VSATPAERVDAAVRRAAMSVIGLTLAEQLETIMSAGFAAILDEVGRQPGSEAPRELPKHPGAVILADVVRGFEFDRPILLVRGTQARHLGRAMWYSPTDEVGGDRWHRDEHVTQWSPAATVSLGGDGPVAALRAILKVAEDRDVEDDVARELVASDARQALAGLDGAS
jgi:hypothetical protein